MRNGEERNGSKGEPKEKKATSCTSCCTCLASSSNSSRSRSDTDAAVKVSVHRRIIAEEAITGALKLKELVPMDELFFPVTNVQFDNEYDCLRSLK